MATKGASEIEIAAFFDAFVTAFRSFSGEEIARRYLAPYSALHADGSIDTFATTEETAEYFQKVVDGYYAKGCRACRYKDLEVVPTGSQSVLATVTWELCRVDGTVLSAWRESYILVRNGADWLVFSSVDHAG